jgi:hypothetical protein
LIFVCHHVESVTPPQGPRLDNLQFGTSPFLNHQALPIAKKPEPAKENAKDNGKRGYDAQERNPNWGSGEIGVHWPRVEG